MALRRTLSKPRLFCAATPDPPPPITALLRSPSIAAPKEHLRREFKTLPDSFFRRFLQRRAINNHALPSFLTLPVGEKLREKLKLMSAAGDHTRRLDGFIPPPTSTAAEDEEFRVTATDAKRVLKFLQIEQIKERLRNIPASTIPYGEFVRICGGACGSSETGMEFAKALDESGNVIVLGGVVFLRPDQVAKSMETLIAQSIALPNDPRRKELDNLENQKAQIDRKARSLVQGELYCGLGFLVLQTLGFMRLTFWELSWDVMEPICFFVTSLHFALAYGFFLRTSKEPSFQGYFQRRFKVKQQKFMEVHNFDLERYNELCEAFYPSYGIRYDDGRGVGSLKHADGTVFGPVHG